MGDKRGPAEKKDRFAPPTNELIGGRQAVLAAICYGTVKRILLAEDSRGEVINEILTLAGSKKITVERLKKNSFLDQAGFIPGHQGVVALVPPYRYCDLDQLIAASRAQADPPFLLMLDHLEDPQNLGAIMRTADAVGIDGLVIPARRAAGVTATVRKVAAGAAERVKVALVTNLSQAAARFKAEGFWLYGAEADGDIPYYQADYRLPLVLVIGSEGKGLSTLLRKNCDQTLSIPMPGKGAGSLNVSAAAAVLIYAALGQREGWSG
ncbi:MAG: 23S rRNA (guanosine(2251)-2'-O)-methyltransferase RlmB [Firmicutes bacterium]|nr:23S rRNA (guanosine(2251)-2'-O)-methyltransferase RlmB [Bacillota bacterium]